MLGFLAVKHHIGAITLSLSDYKLLTGAVFVINAESLPPPPFLSSLFLSAAAAAATAAAAAAAAATAAAVAARPSTVPVLTEDEELARTLTSSLLAAGLSVETLSFAAGPPVVAPSVASMPTDMVMLEGSSGASAAVSAQAVLVPGE